jgi:pyridoxamine 5'-phosphate oxidase-like protein
MGPEAGRPVAPPSYGIPRDAGGLLPWSWAEDRLAASRNYWIVTASGEGRPHAMPVWGLWLERAVWFSTDGDSLKGRNIDANPDVVVHLESGDEVVILAGRAERVTDQATLEPVLDAYDNKYGFRFRVDSVGRVSGDGAVGFVYRLSPTVAFAWREQDYPLSATRWRFPAA